MSKAYFACLSAYNSGILHGVWIDNIENETVDSLHEKIQEMLNSTPDKYSSKEEWAIHDHEGFGGFKISEYEGLESLIKKAELTEEHGDIIGEFAEHVGIKDLDDVESQFEEAYQGAFDSLEDYAYKFTEDTGGLQDCPEHLRNYIDFESMGRDMELGGDIFTIDKGYKQLHVFLNI
jgi:antirestriction protein